LALAQQQIQQKRIERIQAVRDKEKKFAKQQSAQFSELKQCTKKEVEQELAQEWEQRKLKKLQHLKQKYQDLQNSLGLGHHSASTNTQQLHENAVQHQAILSQQHTQQQQRADQALSKLQQKLLAEKSEKSTRAKWRQSAVEMALLHRHKLQKQLEHQYFTLPEGLCPAINVSSSCHASSQHHRFALPLSHNSNRRNPPHQQVPPPPPSSASASDPRYNESRRYTLITSHQNTFDPHPALYLQQIADDHKKYNLKQYLPRKLLKKLNKKYNKSRKKNEQRKKQEKKLKAAGVQLKSDGTQMSSIPEDTTLSDQSLLHQQKQKQKQKQKQAQSAVNDSDVNLNLNPWQNAKQVRQRTANKQRKQTQQFLAAQKRGKIALGREKKKRRAQQLDSEFELMHQEFIKQKLAKCQQIMQQVNTKHQTRQQLQADLEQKFESFFQMHGSNSNSPVTAASAVPPPAPPRGDMDQEMKPRGIAPEPVSYSSPSSSQSASRSCSPKRTLRKTAQTDDDDKADEEKVDEEQNQDMHARTRERISVSIPSVPVAVTTAAISNMEQVEEKQTEDDDDEDNVSVTRSRRVKIRRNDSDGSACVSQTSSMSTSASNSPQKQEQQNGNEQKSDVDNDRVFVPKKWFEKLLQKIGHGPQSDAKNNDSQITSSTISSQAVRLKDFGNGQVAMSRTWFEQLLHDIYAHGGDGTTKDDKRNDEEEASDGIDADDDAVLTRHDMLARETATNSQQSTETSSPRVEQMKPRSHVSECSDVSTTAEDTEDNDADDDDEDDDMSRNIVRLRQSMDSDQSNADRQTVSDMDMSAINIENTEKFIRQSQALLDKTANFFENFSESESMDYTKTDQSLMNKREDIDTLLRSSIHSDSSQWSLSSFSSTDIHKLSASLLPIGNTVADDDENETKQQKEENDDEQSPNTLNMIKPKLLQTLKTPMQTIQELDSSLSQSAHSSTSDKHDAPNVSTPVPCTPNVNADIASTLDASKLDYHSDEEKASVTCSEEEQSRDTVQNVPKAPPLTTDHFKTPINSTNDTINHSSSGNAGGKFNLKQCNPRFTDSTSNTYPSLPPSNRGLDRSSQPTQTSRDSGRGSGSGSGVSAVAAGAGVQNHVNVSALPIQYLNFKDIQISNLHSTTESNSEHNNSAEDDDDDDDDEDDADDADDDDDDDDDSEARNQALRELQKFNDEINEEFEQILNMKRDTNHANANDMSLNMSCIDEVASNSNDSIGEIMAKISNLSTSSFTLSTFQDELQESGKTNDNLLNCDHFYEQQQSKKFPPLTPQDLMGSDAEDESEAEKNEKNTAHAQSNEAQSNHSSLPLFETDDDDDEQQSTSSLQEAYQAFQNKRKQHSNYKMNEKLKKLKMKGKQKKFALNK